MINKYVIQYKAPSPGRKVCFQVVEANDADEAVAKLQAEHGKWAEVILGVFIQMWLGRS